MNHYKSVISPLDLGFLSLRNRFVMGSMHTNLEESPDGFCRLAEFYRERAAHGVALIITGGISPNQEGCVARGGAMLTAAEQMEEHKKLTKAVHDEGGKICMQILHTGRYGYHPEIVAPSSIQAPINVFRPREMSEQDIERTIDDFVRCALLAKQANYDGVEIMGSEGYLINQFIAQRTNKRNDSWGGSYENRIKFPLEIVRRVGQATGPGFLIIFRLSMLDLVDGGSSWNEVVSLAHHLKSNGVHIINTGIGWHEARVPTIASVVPRMAFAWVTKKLKKEIDIPLIAVNRINTPDIAEKIIAEEYADLVSMARPFLADAAFVSKTIAGKQDFINTCIACNQACLDHTFELKISSCLVNPRACHETLMPVIPAEKVRRIGVIGAGPAGLAFAEMAARRGHIITLYEKELSVGGQFLLAKNIPGKEEYRETIRYFENQLSALGVKINLGVHADTSLIKSNVQDAWVVATGSAPVLPDIPGIEHEKVILYPQLLSGFKKAGQKVAVIGAGGIGIDVCTYLLKQHQDPVNEWSDFVKDWNLDSLLDLSETMQNQNTQPQREIFLLKRSTGKHGSKLGKTTGWIHRSYLASQGVQMFAEVEYLGIDDTGLHIRHQKENKLLEVDNIIVCAGQQSENLLLREWESMGLEVYSIGGADSVKELDAKAAIEQGVLLGLKI